MVFAGPVFPEWYWGPIFFLVLLSPVLAAAVVGTDVVARRRRGPLALRVRAGLWLNAVLVPCALVLAGAALVEHVRFERESRAAARDFDFTPYLPRDGLSADLVRAGSDPPVLFSRYDVDAPAYALGYAQRASVVSLRPGRCSLTRLAGTGTTFFEGPCAERRTPGGRRVYLAGRDAFAVLGGTLVRLQSRGVGEPAVLAWFDALRPVQPAEIDWKGP